MTIAFFHSDNRLKKVDFPTLDLPIMAMTGFIDNLSLQV
jgi:hypothetical protein